MSMSIERMNHSPRGTAHSLSEEAEQFIERQIRRKIQYRWILRQNSGEELPLPSGPIPALKTHGSISGSVTTTVTIHLWCLS